MSTEELKYWLSLAKIESIGPVRFQRVINYFPNLSDFWISPANVIIRAGIEPKLAEEIIRRRREIYPDEELKKVQNLKISVITLKDEAYPRLLKQIYAPPPLLYYFGNLAPADDYPLAVVGTRKISGYGRQATEYIVSELAAAGLTIVSGLALGIDACAHQATVAAFGKTIAVLGSGLDNIFPAANCRLAQNIIAGGGAVISEFPPGTPALKQNFPRRNRIISGLSLGTLVVEAGEKSGALITARYALEQNREVFAVPGGIFYPFSAGPNYLIKQGAKPVTAAADILEQLNLKQIKVYRAMAEVLPESAEEKIIFGVLTEPLHIDKLSHSVKLDISVVNSVLALMEIKGLVKNLGGQVYVKAR